MKTFIQRVCILFIFSTLGIADSDTTLDTVPEGDENMTPSICGSPVGPCRRF